MFAWSIFRDRDIDASLFMHFKLNQQQVNLLSAEPGR